MIVQDEQQLVTIAEAAKLLGRSKSTISYWVRTGQIMPYRPQLGRVTRVDLTEIRRKLTVLPDPVRQEEDTE